ncbi:MAG: phosphopyruvate hydratase [Rhodobiaceae bacterium]|nr:phosphopyruvate hydratase [Rhodobiaceae bacterium]RPF95654.1 MAG: phosphopyruvate hydratase [Rhizobiales bacterium TMED227]|tara:strand:+ start:246 stop:1526 length:1281 start_codon:yes stop_codon:yes gene_type:complete
MTKIKKVKGREIIDSRGNPTVEADVELENGIVARYSVPSGASTGIHEAIELRDGDDRYHGMGVMKAVNNINTLINDLLCGFNSVEQEEIDQALIKLDGTDNKGALGANAILAVSIATAKAAASSINQSLYKYLSTEDNFKLPVPMMNILNGGAHADNPINIQEFMIIPANFNTFKDSLRAGAEIFRSLKDNLKSDSLGTSVGDEGGFAPNIKSVESAIEIIIKSIKDAGYKSGKDIFLSLDSASSEFFKDDMYQLEPDRVPLDKFQIIEFYESIIKKYPIISIEDAMSEDDWDGWSQLTKKIGDDCQLVGDDLFVTNKSRLADGINKNIANSILVKVNQIGTLTETLQTINMAKKSDYTCIISHRSGETEDTTIADLAVATNAGQIKTGSLSRSDRTSKYNQLLRIEEELGDRCYFPGTSEFSKYI